jgi:hypothetical protein
MPRRRLAFVLASLGGLALGPLGCFPNVAQHAARAPELDHPGETKCSVLKSTSEPLIVEWPTGARAKLEALSRAGVVAVRYSGCEMEVLASCNAPGKYRYTALTPKRDRVTIKNADDLYASIPLGAARLEAKLETAGQLDVDMSVVGRYAADKTGIHEGDLEGPDCAKATHDALAPQESAHRAATLPQPRWAGPLAPNTFTF